MALSSPKRSNNDRLFCLARKSWVAATPEERLRQCVLGYMLGEGGYPRGLIALEVPIDKHNAARRADIIAYYTPQDGGVLPLLIVECKAVRLNARMLQQVGGYNYYLQAPFVALAAPHESYWGWRDKQAQRYILQSGFPTYAKLLEAVIEPSI